MAVSGTRGDRVAGGPGRDRLLGAAANDLLRGESGNTSTIKGGPGAMTNCAENPAATASSAACDSRDRDGHDCRR